MALPRPFAVDAAPLRQAIVNPLLSTVTASPRGARVVRRAGLNADACVLVVVEDAGAGMSEAAEREHIRRVLARCRGRVGDAARALGVSRTTLWDRMRRLGLPTR